MISAKYISISGIFPVFGKRLRKVQMYEFNSVLIQLLNNHMNALLRVKCISGLRKAVKPFDDKSAQRIILIRIKVKVQPVIQVVQVDRTFYNILAFVNLLNKIFFILIILVVDLTDNLLQNIF